MDWPLYAFLEASLLINECLERVKNSRWAIGRFFAVHKFEHAFLGHTHFDVDEMISDAAVNASAKLRRPRA